MNFSLFC